MNTTILTKTLENLVANYNDCPYICWALVQTHIYDPDTNLAWHIKQLPQAHLEILKHIQKVLGGEPTLTGAIVNLHAGSGKSYEFASKLNFQAIRVHWLNRLISNDPPENLKDLINSYENLTQPPEHA